MIIASLIWILAGYSAWIRHCYYWKEDVALLGPLPSNQTFKLIFGLALCMIAGPFVWLLFTDE